ncbi:MAG: hypothetical protein R3A51_09135 [Nannocystaceae bacterium]
MLHEAAAHGERRRVWLARALEVQAAGAAGRDELLRAAIEEHARAAARGPGDPDLALLNSFAAGIIRHESDRIWMNATGHRTPLVALGTFPGEDQDEAALDAVLDDVLPATEPPAPSPAGDQPAVTPQAPAAPPAELQTRGAP